MLDVGPARHLTCFLPQTSAVAMLEVDEDTERLDCNEDGRSTEGMSYADRLETSHAFG